MTEPDRKASSPERILEIILLFLECDAVTVRMLCERFGGSRSSTYRDLQFLKARGFVAEGAARGSFRLGPVIERLAHSALPRPNLRAIAEPHLRALVAGTGETALLSRRVGDHVVVVLSIDSPQVLRVSASAAADLPLYVGSFGKLLLAYEQRHMTDESLAKALSTAALNARINPAHINPTRLRRELATICERGYAVTDSEVEVGTRSISVPVLASVGGASVAALTLAAPSLRLPQRRIRQLVALLQGTAARIDADWAESERKVATGTPRRASA